MFSSFFTSKKNNKGVNLTANNKAKFNHAFGGTNKNFNKYLKSLPTGPVQGTAGVGSPPPIRYPLGREPRNHRTSPSASSVLPSASGGVPAVLPPSASGDVPAPTYRTGLEALAFKPTPVSHRNVFVGSAPVIPMTPIEYLKSGIEGVMKNVSKLGSDTLIGANPENAYFLVHAWVIFRNSGSPGLLVKSSEIRTSLIKYFSNNPGKINEFHARDIKEYLDGTRYPPSTAIVGEYLTILQRHINVGKSISEAFNILDKEKPLVFKGLGGRRKTRRSRKYKKKHSRRR